MHGPDPASNQAEALRLQARRVLYSIKTKTGTVQEQAKVKQRMSVQKRRQIFDAHDRAVRLDIANSLHTLTSIATAGIAIYQKQCGLTNKEFPSLSQAERNLSLPDMGVHANLFALGEEDDSDLE